MLTSSPVQMAEIRFMPGRAGEQRFPAPNAATQCATCPQRAHCLPGELEPRLVRRLDELHFARRRVRAGQKVFHHGDRFAFLYAVRSGTFKASLAAPDGRELVTGFHLPGELLGLDALAAGRHASTASALEDGEVCAIPYRQLMEEVGAGGASVYHGLSRMLSREIVREHHLMLLLGGMNAEERLAAFLMNVSQRMQVRGYSSTEFNLRMSRAEIGSLLGLTVETVSRALSAFQRQGLLRVDRRHISAMDVQRLRQEYAATVQ